MIGGLGHSAVLCTLPLGHLTGAYAVCSRSPKPLRASHTRKALSEMSAVGTVPLYV